MRGGYYGPQHPDRAPRSGVNTPSGAGGSASNVEQLRRYLADSILQISAAVLGQLFLVACVLSTLGIAGIFFVLFGPVPQKRSVVILPRLSAPRFVAPVAPVAAPSLVAQLAPVANKFFTPPQPIQAAPQTTFEPLPAAYVPTHAVPSD